MIQSSLSDFHLATLAAAMPLVAKTAEQEAEELADLKEAFSNFDRVSAGIDCWI